MCEDAVDAPEDVGKVTDLLTCCGATVAGGGSGVAVVGSRVGRATEEGEAAGEVLGRG